MRFTKMHGCGNDYVYVDCWQEQPPADPAALADLARAVSDRHTGIGADGLILVGPSDIADAQMRMWNADGSESGMCGNGLRCAAALAWNNGHLPDSTVGFETGAGVLAVTCLLDADQLCHGAAVDMGPPRLEPKAIPVASASSDRPIRLQLPLGADGPQAAFTCVGMGNPHAVTFFEHLDDVEAAPLASWGPPLEHHPSFPERCNIEFVAILEQDTSTSRILRQRTWERGSGETEACGTGACAVTVAAIATGRIPAGEHIVRLNGGDLQIRWNGSGNITMTGEAITVFTGSWPSPQLPS